MGVRKELEKRLLDRIAQELGALGFSTETVLPEGERREAVLLISPENLGDREDKLQVEASFLPRKEEEIEQYGYNVLQLFSCLRESLSPGTCNELARAVLRLNPKIPGGALGIDERKKMLYYKSSIILTDNMDERVGYSLIEIQLGIFLNTLDRCNDVLMDIADGRRTADEAIKKRLI
jgi:hypothetical protein